MHNGCARSTTCIIWKYYCCLSALFTNWINASAYFPDYVGKHSPIPERRIDSGRSHGSFQTGLSLGLTFSTTLFHLRDGHDISPARPELLNGNLPRIQSALRVALLALSMETRLQADAKIADKWACLYFPHSICYKTQLIAHDMINLRLCVLFLLFTLLARRWRQSHSAAGGYVWAVNCALHVD